MTNRHARVARALGRSAGWSSPVLVEMLGLLVLLTFILGGVLSDSRAVRVGSIVLFAVIVLVVFVTYRLRRIRQGSEVEVTRRGKSLGRRGTVVKVLRSGTFFEVRLHEVRDDATTIPSESVELCWFDLKKVLFRR